MPPPSKQLIVVRPYHPAIRARITEALKTLEYDLDNAYVIATGTPDDDVLAALKTRRSPRALLMPFHAHKGTRGGVTDGLTVLMRLRAELPAFAKTPVVMPVSQIGHAGFLLRMTELGKQRPTHHTPVMEEELDDQPALLQKLKAAGF